MVFVTQQPSQTNKEHITRCEQSRPARLGVQRDPGVGQAEVHPHPLPSPPPHVGPRAPGHWLLLAPLKAGAPELGSRRDKQLRLPTDKHKCYRREIVLIFEGKVVKYLATHLMRNMHK